MTPTVIHVGLRKTATSMLQRRVFPALEGWTYLGIGAPQFSELNGFVRELLWASDAEFAPGPFADFLAAAGRDRAGVVVSREHLSTFHLNGRRPEERLHAVCPEARIVIGIRSQRTALVSGYSEYLKRGGTSRFPDWAVEVRDCIWLHGDRVIEDYQGAFGPAAVKVLPLERLVADRAGYLDELLGFMGPTATLPADALTGSRENSSLSPGVLAVLRRVNRLFFRSENELREPFRRFRRVPTRLALVKGARVLDRFVPRSRRAFDDGGVVERELPYHEETNARIQELTGLALDDLGYPLPR